MNVVVSVLPPLAPGRMVSLLDLLMLNLGRLFDNLHLMISFAQSIEGALGATEKTGGFPGIKSPTLEEMHSSAKEVQKRCQQLGFVVAERRADDVVARLSQWKVELGKGDTLCISRQEVRSAAYDIDELYRRVCDETDARQFVLLQPALAPLYGTSTGHFGQEVEDAFPRASEDIAEAAKCLALERATASVFHLMRVMEIAVQELARKLNIPDVEREWGKLLAAMKPVIEAMCKGDERKQWSECFSLLYHVKESWRNSTMHPKQTYTLEEAQTLYAAVRGFMGKLASLP